MTRAQFEETAVLALPIEEAKTVHITTQGKGGVFKSGITALVAQYLQDRGHTPRCLDTDPTNATFAKFEDLAVTHIGITEGNYVNLERFNVMADELVQNEGPFVIDTGATTFLPFWDYVAQTQLIEFLQEADRRVVIHCPVVGGQSMQETLKGFAAIAQLLPSQSIVVWLNGYYGPIATGGKKAQEFTVFQEHSDKIIGYVQIGDGGDRLLQVKELRNLLSRNQTFRQVLNSSENSIARRILFNVKNEVYRQLEALGL
jgi:hypothetical protein